VETSHGPNQQTKIMVLAELPKSMRCGCARETLAPSVSLLRLRLGSLQIGALPSAAGRKRISEMMKARWAARRKAAKKA
jgi:hypothetical protein